MRARSIGAAVMLAGLLAAPGLARADEPTDLPVLLHAKREIGVLPLVGGDTDNGFGAGALGSVAQFDPGYVPYRWQVQFGAFYATKTDVLSPTFEDAFASIIFPQLADHRLRLEVRPSFTRDTALRYYGIGNLTTDRRDVDPRRDFYERTHPALAATMRWKLHGPLSVLVGAGYTYNLVRFAPESTVARDMALVDPMLAAPHSVIRGETGMVYDTRDNELAPRHGQFHQIKLRVSPRIGDAIPYAYQQVDAIARFYTTLVPHRLVLAVRGVVDLQTGDVPLYELARYEDTSAIGGGLGVRGVPAYRFYGKAKAFGNVELRLDAAHFSVGQTPFLLGFATFFDAGRLWSDPAMGRPDLDGSGLAALHYGVGGGLRVQQGRAFLVRADVAWSPDARPVGAYLLADHIF